jgi:hypothetical protein
MSSYDSEKERERARRIRDAQIEQRDPGPRIKDVNWTREGQPKRKPEPLLVSMFNVLPGRYQGALIGLVLGLLLVIVAVLVLPSDLKILGLAGLLICCVLGFAVGGATDKNKW